MKTVSGKVESCEPVSLSKAAKILSKFASSDNGASPAFAAYLRRASASFDELAQLHKGYKRSGSKHKVKKQHSNSIFTEGTVESVTNHRKDGLLSEEIGTFKRKELRGVNKSEGEAGRIDVGLNVDEETKKHKSKNRRDEDEGRHTAGSMDVQNVEGVVGRNAGDVRGDGKKSKKKRDNNEDVAVAIKDQPYIDNDAVNASELKNGEEDGSKRTKKKKKRDEREKQDAAADIEKEVQNHHHSQNDRNGQAIETGKSYGNKQKKHKTDQTSGDSAAVNAIVVKNETVSLDGSKERKKKKKRDKPEKETSDDPVDIEKEILSHPSCQVGVNREATQIVESNGDEQKKRKKNKKKNEITEERVSSGVKDAEQRVESNGDYGNIDIVDKGGEVKKHKKKRPHEGKERESEGKLEIEAGNNKESRKRKHETFAAGELEGSQEKHKSKKKKR